MSGVAGVLTACPDFQESLYNAYNISPDLGAEVSPFLQMLTSDLSTSVLQQSVISGKGKIKSAKLIHFRRFLESEASEDVDTDSCPSGSFEANVEFDVDFDTTDNVQSKVLSMTASDLEAYCHESNGQYFANMVAMQMDQVARKVATKTANSVVGTAGEWDTKVSSGLLSGNIFQFDTYDGSGNIRRQAMREFKRSTQKNGYRQPILFSGDNIYDYYLDVEEGCCSDEGINLAGILSKWRQAVVYDYRVAEALGDLDTMALLTQPGAFALLAYTKAPWREDLPGYVKTVASNYAEFVVVDPVYNIPMDLKIVDDCGTISWSVTATTQLKAAPVDTYKIGDNKEDVNMINYVQQV